MLNYQRVPPKKWYFFVMEPSMNLDDWGGPRGPLRCGKLQIFGGSPVDFYDHSVFNGTLKRIDAMSRGSPKHWWCQNWNVKHWKTMENPSTSRNHGFKRRLPFFRSSWMKAINSYMQCRLNSVGVTTQSAFNPIRCQSTRCMQYLCVTSKHFWIAPELTWSVDPSTLW